MSSATPPRTDSPVNVTTLWISSEIGCGSGGDTRMEVEYGEPQPARGWSQGVALEQGRGRVVVLAKAAMLSA